MITNPLDISNCLWWVEYTNTAANSYYPYGPDFFIVG